MKKAIIGIIFGGVVHYIGVTLYDGYKVKTLGNILAYSGIYIASIFTIVLVYFTAKTLQGKMRIFYQPKSNNTKKTTSRKRIAKIQRTL